jgi:hypothetical protein
MGGSAPRLFEDLRERAARIRQDGKFAFPHLMMAESVAEKQRAAGISQGNRGITTKKPTPESSEALLVD